MCLLWLFHGTQSVGLALLISVLVGLGAGVDEQFVDSKVRPSFSRVTIGTQFLGWCYPGFKWRTGKN